MDYEELKQRTNRGWNTWNTANVMSHVYLPYGFMINLCLKDYSRCEVLREALVGRFPKDEYDCVEKIHPGLRSWDGRYTSFHMSYGTLELRVESGVENDQQIILVTPLSCTCKTTPTLVVEACLVWNREGTVSKKNGILTGEFADGKKIRVFTTGKPENKAYMWSISPSFTLELTEPVVISTMPCSLDQARAILDRGRAETQAAMDAFGDKAELYNAMKTCLAWDTIYDPEHDRVCSPVSRLWNQNWGGYVLFDWDTYFAGLMAAIDNKELAYLNVIAVTDEATADGFVPNCGAAHGYVSRDRSEPPVGAVCAWEIYKQYREDWFLRRVYPTLLGWNKWYYDRRSTPEGYMCWGSNWFESQTGKYFESHDVGNLQGAAFESGLDNSPMYDDAVYDPQRGIMLQADVGLMGMFIKDCDCLIEMAKVIGREADIPALEARRDHVKAALMTQWSEEDGIFENLDLATGKLSKHVSPTNFYSLFCDQVTDAQKESISRRFFYNPEEFWGEYMIPSISRRDPGYQDQQYWRGRIWGPMNLLTYWALKDAGMYKEAVDLADKSETLLLKEWREQGHVHENYNCNTGEGCDVGSSDKFYHWGGLLGYVAIDAQKLREQL